MDKKIQITESTFRLLVKYFLLETTTPEEIEIIKNELNEKLNKLTEREYYSKMVSAKTIDEKSKYKKLYRETKSIQ